MTDVTNKRVYDINNVPEDVVKILYTIIQNSTRKSLNAYLQGRGGTADIISQQQYDQLVDLANMIADRTQKSNI